MKDDRSLWGPRAGEDSGEPTREGRPDSAAPVERDRPTAEGDGAGPILAGRDVVRRYAGRVGVTAVRGASVELFAKDFVALMGPSGSGKTTFLGVLSGLDRPDQGEVSWRGRPIGSLSASELTDIRRRRMGIVFQSFGLLPALSAAENVEMPLRVAGGDPRHARARVMDWLERLGLADRVDNRTFELSAGQQQRVAVARALITDPDVVLADEPIAEVDTENADIILEALWDVVRRGGAVLAATHNPEALRYANRVVLFRDGVVEAEGSPSELAAQITTD